MGSEQKTLVLCDVDPAIEGTFEVDGIAVTTVFEKVKAEAAKFTPEATESETGIHPDTVRQEARLFAKAKKAILMNGFNIGRYSNGIYTGWAQSLMLAITGHGGKAGGMDTSWVEWNHGKLLELALFGFQKFPRLEAGGLGEFMRGHMIEHARNHFDNEKLKKRVGFDLDGANRISTLIQPLELCGSWGRLGFKLWKYNANQLAHESSIDVEPA